MPGFFKKGLNMSYYETRNLLTETTAFIEKNGKTPEDIIFIGNEETGECCSWEEFKVLADKDYLEEHGARKVRKDFVIIFSDRSRIYRYTYDNLGEFKFIKRFEMPEQKSKIETFFIVEDDELMLEAWDMICGKRGSKKAKE